VNPLTRGACPGISEPMPTGDGLLARLMPAHPMTIDAFAALCDAGAADGNGIIEVTQRGSLQVRGLTPASAPGFARTAVALGLGAEGAPGILTSPLMGLDPQERMDLTALVAALREELTRHAAFTSLGPKVSVLIDGGGALHLDDQPGDVRLRAGADSRLHLSIAGTARSSTSLGRIEPHHALEAIVGVLTGIARRGVRARARDLANDVDVAALRTALAGMLTEERPENPRPPADPLGTHSLNNGRVAQGVALAFGYAEAGVLKRFAQAVADCGATSIQPAPGRALLAVGMPAAAAAQCAAAAAAAGFIQRSDDARRFVVACAGAPACGSAAFSTRQLAPAVVQAALPFLDGSLTIHLSGCAKGCAHSGAAALTLVGPDRLVVQGRAADTPQGRISAADFISGLARLQSQRRRSAAAQECSADIVSRLGGQGVLQVMGGERLHD
jgi:precorrin-3B synthase